MSVKPETFIGSTLKVHLHNSKTLIGILTVIDPFGNMLLSEVTETSSDLLNKSVHTRELGLVSVPKASVKSILLNKRSFRILGLESIST